MVDHTPDGLPVITIKSLRSLAAILKREEYAYDADALRQIEAENSFIYKAIERYRKSCDAADRTFAFGMYFTYEVLRRQAAANKLENELTL